MKVNIINGKDNRSIYNNKSSFPTYVPLIISSSNLNLLIISYYRIYFLSFIILLLLLKEEPIGKDIISYKIPYSSSERNYKELESISSFTRHFPLCTFGLSTRLKKNK